MLPLTVSNALTVTTSTTLPNATVTVAYNQTLVAAGCTGTGYTWTVTAGATSLAALNLSVSSTGVITGTPTAATSVTFTAKVMDSTSATASPLTYTIPVTTTSTVSGQIILLNNCTSVSLPAITVSINTTPVQTTTTASNGSFSFSNVPNGTYTITPSISGPSSVFYPATESVTVSGTTVTAPSINVALGYTVSGTVAYAGSNTGKIYLSLIPTSCGGGGTEGTSISAAGAYTIRGVPPGPYPPRTS